MGSLRILLFANVGEGPFRNNLLPAIRGFERAGVVRLVEPWRFPGFVSTGGARPAEVPLAALAEGLADFAPDLIACLGGGLRLPPGARARLPVTCVVAAIALSDPLGLAASLAIAPGFDLFYTQDPQTLPLYRARGIEARRCDPAVDPELFAPVEAPPDCDVVFYGKWTPYRDALLRRLAGRVHVRLHGHAGESRWTLPSLPSLDDPEALRRGIGRARLALELARLDDAPAPFRDTWRLTPRLHLASACGVPSLVEASPRLAEFYAPGEEVEPFACAEDLVARAAALLADEPRRREMGCRARARVLRQHTWEHRVRALLADAAAVRPRIRPSA